MINLLSPYATNFNYSKGRQYPESLSDERSPFQRDRDRIIHSGAFRRLKHKTQVFVYHTDDYFRTRLTHSIEVSQIARTISRSLKINEDLSETLALAHDLGHTPFGHAGEDALNDITQPWGGFDHNAQTLKILTSLEHRYANFDGLNLTWETLEGVVKHNGPLVNSAKKINKLSRYIFQYNNVYDLDLERYPSLEAQVASFSDDIAYNNHDIDDGLRAGLFKISDLSEVPIIGRVIKKVIDLYGSDLESSRLYNEIVRRSINVMVLDLINETKKKINDLDIQTIEDIRNSDSMIASFSDKMSYDNKLLKEFLYNNMYKHPFINNMTDSAKIIIKDLFQLFKNDYNLLPDSWRKKITKKEHDNVVLISDYLSGMTDRYALKKHKSLCFNNNIKYDY